MIERLNPWQRFWAMFGGIVLLSVLVLIVAMWPRQDAAIVADLGDPACQQWRDAADYDGAPIYYPEEGAPCRALQLFLFEEHQVLHSKGQYNALLIKRGLRYSVNALAMWAGFMGLIYALGIFARKLVNVMPGHRDRGGG